MNAARQYLVAIDTAQLKELSNDDKGRAHNMRIRLILTLWGG